MPPWLRACESFPKERAFDLWEVFNFMLFDCRYGSELIIDKEINGGDLMIVSLRYFLKLPNARRRREILAQPNGTRAT